MYLAETDNQTNSLNAIHIDIIQSMEQVMNAIDSFAGATLLQGKTYKSAKTYMFLLFRPLAQGIIDLSEELIRQNDSYPSDFRSQVATTDVIEEKIKMQIEKIDRLIESLKSADDVLPMVGLTLPIYQKMKRTLERKLADLYAFNAITGSNYDMALDLAEGVLEGLNQVQDGNGFNSKDGTFSTEEMSFDWISKLNEAQSMIKAKEKYPDYFEKNKDDRDKLVGIIEYEEKHPEKVKDTDEFLSPLEEQDVVEIKYLMYTAEEPYRSLALAYAGRLEIIKEEVDPDKSSQPSYFTDKDNTITYVYEKDRTNDRGQYFTFFHELGHAIDHNYGVDEGVNGFYSHHYKTEGKNLTEHMFKDVKDTINTELRDELNQSSYKDLDDDVKAKMISNVTDAYIYKETAPEINLSEEEMEVYKEIKSNLSSGLHSDVDNNASDIYSGVTVNQIEGKWAHHDDEYWIDEETGERINQPNKEGYASYYASFMIEDGDQSLSSMDDYIPDSVDHMERMFSEMGENNE